MPRLVLNPAQVSFEVSLAIGQVPRSVWVRVRSKDRLASEEALKEVVAAVAARFAKLEVSREVAEREWPGPISSR